MAGVEPASRKFFQNRSTIVVRFGCLGYKTQSQTKYFKSASGFFEYHLPEQMIPSSMIDTCWHLLSVSGQMAYAALGVGKSGFAEGAPDFIE